MNLDDPSVQILIGRPNRKLRGHVSDIKAWHGEGVSVRGIHRLLELKGVTANYQSVYREVQKIKVNGTDRPPKKHKPTIEKPEVQKPIVHEMPDLGALFKRQREREALLRQTAPPKIGSEDDHK